MRRRHHHPLSSQAAMFLATSVHYRAVLREFDAQDGLRRVLNILRALVAQLR